MSGKAGEIVVGDVLGHEISGGMAVLFDGYGSESGGCNVFDQVQADHRLMPDARSLGLRMAQVTPSIAVEESADGVCAEDTRRCWPVLVAASSRIVEKMAEELWCGAIGREEGIRSRGSSSCLQGNERTRCESVLDGIDCCDLEWKLHESTLGDSLVGQSSKEQRIAWRGAGISSHLHNDHGIGVARFDKHLDSPETGMETRRLCAGCDLLRGRCGVGCVGNCCGSDGGRGNRKTERDWSVCRYTENTLDKSPEYDRQKHCCGRTGCAMGGSLGVCGIEGVSGRECKTNDRAQNRSGQQMSGEVETCLDFFVTSKNVALEHCKNHNVAGFSLEFERVDDDQDTKRRDCDLECENGGKRDWRAEAIVDGIGPVVETLAEDGSQMDREMQHERRVCHQRTSTQLGRSCGQNGLQKKSARKP